MKIWFDMDGTIADLYSVENWLPMLQVGDPAPYIKASVMWNMSFLARLLNQVQRAGHEIGIISWTAKNGTDLYNGQVALAKMTWLHRHLKSVTWDEIKIVPYGTSKIATCGNGILFDDEIHNRNEWGEGAYAPDKIIEVLKGLVK